MKSSVPQMLISSNVITIGEKTSIDLQNVTFDMNCSVLLRWPSIAFWPRASWFRKTRDGASSQNSTAKSRGRSYTKMPTNMASTFSKDMFITKVAWISFSFIHRIEDPTLLYLIKRKKIKGNYEEGVDI